MLIQANQLESTWGFNAGPGIFSTDFKIIQNNSLGVQGICTDEKKTLIAAHLQT